MASTQCCKPCNQTCSQGQQHHQSLGEKLSGMVGSVFRKEESHQTHSSSQQTQYHTSNGVSATRSETHCTSQTVTGHGHSKGVQPGTGTITDGSKCQGKTRRNHGGERKKRGLLQKIKDGISGNSDGESGSSSSSSESESEGEKCGRKKN